MSDIRSTWGWSTHFKLTRCELSLCGDVYSGGSHLNSPVTVRWTFALTGQWWRTHGRGRLSHSRSASVRNSSSGRERGTQREKGVWRCRRSRRSTHHGRDGEELDRQRRHWHHSLVVVLHKICLQASVVLEEGRHFTSGSEVAAVRPTPHHHPHTDSFKNLLLKLWYF